MMPIHSDQQANQVESERIYSEHEHELIRLKEINKILIGFVDKVANYEYHYPELGILALKDDAIDLLKALE